MVHHQSFSARENIRDKCFIKRRRTVINTRETNDCQNRIDTANLEQQQKLSLDNLALKQCNSTTSHYNNDYDNDDYILAQSSSNDTHSSVKQISMEADAGKINHVKQLTIQTPIQYSKNDLCADIINATVMNTNDILRCQHQQLDENTKIQTEVTDGLVRKLLQTPFSLFKSTISNSIILDPSCSIQPNTDRNNHLHHSNNNHRSDVRDSHDNCMIQIKSSIKTVSSLSPSLVTGKRKFSNNQLLNNILLLATLYLCSLYQYHVTNHASTSFIQIAEANRIVIKPADRVVLTPGHELSLRCEVADYPHTQFRWYRIKQLAKNVEPQIEQPQEEELLPDDDKYTIHNNLITIRSPNLNDVGDYYCRVVQDNLAGIVEKEKMVKVRVRPFIEEFRLATSTGRSAVLTEGERLVLTCNVMDDFAPSVDIQWFKSKFPDDETEMEEIPYDGGSNRLRLESVNATSKSLTIDSVTKEDRSYYKCQAANGVTDNSKVIMIRVRDKLMALWPTIGIILELIILFGVIFVAENRKVEPDFDTSGRKIIQM